VTTYMMGAHLSFEKGLKFYQSCLVFQPTANCCRDAFFSTAVDFRVRTMAASWDPWILGSLAPGRLAGVVRLGALSTFYFNSALVAHFLTIPGPRLFGKGLSEPWQSWALISFSEVAFSGCFLATSLRENWQVATVLSTQVECGISLTGKAV